MFYVCKCQLLIGKFSSCWLNLLTWKAPYLPSPGCRHLSEEAEVQDNPASSYKKRLSRELALGEGKVVEYQFVRDSIIWSLSKPAGLCLWTEDGREGRGWGFFMYWLLWTGPPGTHVFLHYSDPKWGQFVHPGCDSFAQVQPHTVKLVWMIPFSSPCKDESVWTCLQLQE